MLVSLVQLRLHLFNVAVELLQLLEVRHQLIEDRIVINIFHEGHIVIQILKAAQLLVCENIKFEFWDLPSSTDPKTSRKCSGVSILNLNRASTCLCCCSLYSQSVEPAF